MPIRSWHRLLAATVVVGIAAVAVEAPEGVADPDARVKPGASNARVTHAHAAPNARVTRSAPVVRVTSTRLAGAGPIEKGFIGLSVEFTNVLRYTGTDPTHIDPVFEQLIRNLTPGGSPSLRIGGISTDHAWWPLRGVVRPHGVTYTVTPTWIAAVAALFRDLGARGLLGINFEAGRPALAAAEARAFVSGIGRAQISGLEIGNEPSNYPHFAWYRIHGHGVPGRPPTYRFPQFARDFARFAQRLRGFPIAGPALAGYGWLEQLRPFLRAVPSVSTVTFHRYPLNRCFPPAGSPEEATPHNLLTPFAAGGFLAPARPYVALAHAHGARFRLDEFNSVSCSGKVGVSDTFASALWAIDSLFEVAADGIDGVNVHTFPGSPYAPFDVRRRGGAWSAAVHPEYYGLLLFARAAPPGATLLAVGGQTPSAVRIWATRGPDQRTRVVLINKDPRRSYQARLSLASAHGAAVVQRLLGPSLRATDGVTLGGQSVPSGSLDGQLTGVPRSGIIEPSANRYLVTVPPASAALLIGPRSPH